MVKYLSQKESIDIDAELTNKYKFSEDQLTELSGISCASAIAKTYPRQKLSKTSVLICCGSGNNGADGLACARHLKMFQYAPVVYYPKRSDGPLYQALTVQCEQLGIPVMDKLSGACELEDEFGLIVDALFGYGFKPPIRDMYERVMNILKNTRIPIISVDIPSGWEVDQGEPKEGSIKPNMLVSLTAPKKCAKYFKGPYHYLGGRYVPPALAEKYKLKLPAFPDTDMCVLLN